MINSESAWNYSFRRMYIIYWRFSENQGLLVLVQPVCVFQAYELLLQQYFWLTVKYILLNYLKTISYIHMADKCQAFHSVYICEVYKWYAFFIYLWINRLCQSLFGPYSFCFSRGPFALDKFHFYSFYPTSSNVTYVHGKNSVAVRPIPVYSVSTHAV